MAKKEPPYIDEIIENGWLVEFWRKSLEKGSSFGFVLACNDKFSLIQNFVDEHYYLNGYSVIRNKDVSRYRVFDDENYFLSIILRKKRIKPKPLDNISIESWPDVLVSANQQFPLITIHREEVDNKSLQVGKVEEAGKKKFSLLEIDTDATWDKAYKYKYSELTKVDFGGLYEDGLNIVSEYDKKQSVNNVSGE